MIVDKKRLERLPFNGTFELTARCNLRCKMCLIRIDHIKMRELGGRERTASEWIRMAREVLDAGTIAILITGGEPMLRPDFVEIYRAIAQMGFIVTLYTNATLITNEILEVLKEYPPHRIGITTYGASPEIYERVTGNANAYHRMVEGVQQLRQLPSKLSIRTTLIKDNLEDLDRMTEWALNVRKDVEFNVSRIVTKPVRGGIADVEACRLTPKENVAMLRERNMNFIIKPFNKFMKESMLMRKDSNLPDFDFMKEEQKKPKEKATLYGCDAGMTSYCISWDGKLIGCQMLGDCWTNPFDTGFKAAWGEFPRKVKLPPLPQECIGCDVTCSACPANRLAETSSLGGLPEYLCKESKLADEMKQELVAELQEIMCVEGSNE